MREKDINLFLTSGPVAKLLYAVSGWPVAGQTLSTFGDECYLTLCFGLPVACQTI